MVLGVVGFLSPNHIATGGTAGLAIVLHHVINLPIGCFNGFGKYSIILVA
jgi:uncharacterized membrane-anchored protein YitT (DUF2179 family)